MTGRKYKEKEFLRNIDIGLLEQYLKPFNLQLPNEIDRDNPDIDKLLNFLESLDPDIKDKKATIEVKKPLEKIKEKAPEARELAERLEPLDLIENKAKYEEILTQNPTWGGLWELNP